VKLAASAEEAVGDRRRATLEVELHNRLIHQYVQSNLAVLTVDRRHVPRGEAVEEMRTRIRAVDERLFTPSGYTDQSLIALVVRQHECDLIGGACVDLKLQLTCPL